MHPDLPGSRSGPGRNRPGPGDVIGGFRLEERLRQAATGVVYRARQLSLDRIAALTVLSADAARDDARVEQFLADVRRAASLEHAHIVPIYGAGEDHGAYFVAMGFIQGETLAERVQRRGPLSEREAVVLVQKIGQALEYAWNEHRLLHGRISPECIVLDAQGEPRLVNLGFPGERAAAELSPNYLSPEEIGGTTEHDVRTDIYGLGATLYHALTGALDVAETHRYERLPDPRDFNPRLSPFTLQLLQRMLAQDPGQRLQDWPSCLAVMDRLLKDHLPPPRSRPRRRSYARRAAALLAPALAAACAIAIVALNRDAVDPDDEGEVIPDPGMASPLSASIARRIEALSEAIPHLRQAHRVAACAGGIAINLSGAADFADVTLLAGLPIRRLYLAHTAVSNIAGLREMELTTLDLSDTAVSDLAPLQGMPLEHLKLADCVNVTDIWPLQGMELQTLSIRGTQVDNISALKGMPIEEIDLACTPVRSIEALRDMPIRGGISLARTKVADLRPLKDMPLTWINLWETPVEDIEPLRGMPLTEVDLTATKVTDLRPLSNMELRSLDLNLCSRLADLTPLQGISLQRITLRQTQVTDIEALRGMPIKEIDITFTRVSDVSPLKGMPLQGGLALASTAVTDISPLQGMPLTWLNLWQTPVADLAPLRGMPLYHLDLGGCTNVADLTPLMGMPLHWLNLWGCENIRDFAPLGSLANLQTLQLDKGLSKQLWDTFADALKKDPKVAAEIARGFENVPALSLQYTAMSDSLRLAGL
jgi:Leucine-rich repeat (LRR) protein